MKIIPFQAVIPDLSKIEATEAFFNSVKEEYPKYSSQNLFKKTGLDAFYVYEITTINSVHTGVVAALDLDDYRDGKVKKHENTLLEKEKIQMTLLLERKAMVKPILLTYKHAERIEAKLELIKNSNDPFYEIYFNKIKQHHRFWQVATLDEITAFQQLFEENIACCYLGDGHHRLSSNLLLDHNVPYNGKEKFDEALCAFFADAELVVQPFHRVFKDPDISEADIINKVKSYAEQVDLDQNIPSQKGEWSMCIKGKWSSWRWKNELVESYRSNRHVVLDVDILNDKILHEALGVEDIRKDKRIAYVEGNKAISSLVKMSAAGVSFRLFPVDIEDLMIISDDGDIMPPKSTFFEPRMLNGLLVQELPDALLG
jgi:uncharacterized protein (DUF1015 family)